MANLMKMKRSSVPGKVPTTADLDLGEIAINTYDGKVYMKKNVSGVETVVLLTGAGAGDVLGPASSADNAIARFDGTSGKIIQNSGATIDDSGNVTALTNNATGTSANTMPVGTTAQRPSTPTAGMYRMNSTLGEPEWWDAGASKWQPFRDLTYDIEYLVVGGGGCGGGNGGGGGGGGGYRCSVVGEASGGGASAEPKLNLIKGQTYTVIIGAGGSSTSTGSNYSSAGGYSQFGSISSQGGGGGGHGGNLAYAGGPGGCGGGAGSYGVYYPYSGGAGTSGQGYKGGDATSAGVNLFKSAGGGGAGSAGPNLSYDGTNTGGIGGQGVTSSINGTATVRSGGGSGYLQYSYVAGSQGANSGGGGSLQLSTVGNSGVVVIRYPGAQRGSGGTVTTATISGQLYTIHTFTSSGTYTA